MHAVGHDTVDVEGAYRVADVRCMQHSLDQQYPIFLLLQSKGSYSIVVAVSAFLERNHTPDCFNPYDHRELLGLVNVYHRWHCYCYCNPKPLLLQQNQECFDAGFHKLDKDLAIHQATEAVHGNAGSRKMRGQRGSCPGEDMLSSKLKISLDQPKHSR